MERNSIFNPCSSVIVNVLRTFKASTFNLSRKIRRSCKKKYVVVVAPSTTDKKKGFYGNVPIYKATRLYITMQYFIHVSPLISSFIQITMNRFIFLRIWRKKINKAK